MTTATAPECITVRTEGRVGIVTLNRPTQLNALNINDGPATFNVKVRTDDGHGNTTTSASVALNVTNVAPTIAVSGNATVNEGSVYTLNLGAVTDPGSDAVFRYLINWGDGATDDVEGNPANTTRTHTYTDGTFVRDVKVSLFDDDGLPHANAGAWWFDQTSGEESVPHPEPRRNKENCAARFETGHAIGWSGRPGAQAR